MFLFRDTILSDKTEIIYSLKKIKGLSLHKSIFIKNHMGLSYSYKIKNLNYYNLNLLLYLLKKFNIKQYKN